jgi:NitT/TauT family transport system permease protein
LRPISPIAWFPLAVLWFGIGNPPAIFIIFLAAFFPILLATISGVRDVDPLHLKVAANFGAGRVFTFLAVILPAAFPHVMVGLHIALGTAWIHLVAGEMLGAQSGLGYLIVDARNFLRTDLIIAGMLLVGVLGLAINAAMRRAEGLVRRRWGAA